MMRQFELVERVQRYNPNANEALLNKAYVYAMQAHGAQTRASGDPYFSHPLEVAAILTDHRLDDSTIAAALLHDTVEDTDATLSEINDKFGSEIGQLVDGLTKIKRLDLVSKKAAQAENLRRLLLSVANDIRVLLVKLADRLHNMRTLGHVPSEKRARIAEETMEIYAPLAGRMGMQEMRDELEDLAFRWLHPDAYETITAKLEKRQESYRSIATEIESNLANMLIENGMFGDTSWRAKRAYSVWRKMNRKNISLEQLSDVLAFRVIVRSVSECYRVLGLIHTRWAMVPDRFKDYISTPKANDYRSIHTTVIGPGSERVELQIRTFSMHDVAEFGVAAHALYADRKTDSDKPFDVSETRSYRWLSELVEMIESGDNPEDFLEHTKLELFQDQVFCFSPKGRLIALPRGATPIDFAYAVHTDVGNSCVGCKINGQIAPLSGTLSNGDEVEIIRSEAHSPPAAWESIATTGKARAAIRRATRDAIRAQYAEFGREVLVRVFSREGLNYSDKKLEAVLHRLAREDVRDVLAAVGRGEMPSEHVVRAMYPNSNGKTVAPAPSPDEGWFGLRRAMGLKFRVPQRATRQKATGAMSFRGLRNDLPVKFAPGGGAVPGDRVVGIMTPGEGITIYPIHAPELKNFESEPDRWLDIRWDMDETRKERFPAQVRLTVLNEPGTLARVAQIIGETGGNIDNIDMISRTHDFREISMDLEVWDLKHLNRIIQELRETRVVSSAVRTSN
ncbi:MAG: bifunctional (p)ppGpp synthetase/guanosine-3',5'-bis(diphosphate) 3'-pyrophosphohydrolase [Pseudomonadota bacterium]